MCRRSLVRYARRNLRFAAAVLLIAVGPFPRAATEPWENRAPILPAPEPFTLSSYDVIDAVWMIRRSFALVYRGDDGTRRTVPVRTVRSVWVGFDPDAYEHHQNRYDVLLNGEPLDWEHLYIAYNGDLVNLRLLFTYRNQQPVPEVQYRLE